MGAGFRVFQPRPSEVFPGGEALQREPPVKRRLTFTFCAGFTPTGTGPDAAMLAVPDPTGTQPLYNVVEAVLSVLAAGGAPAVLIERSRPGGPFAAQPVARLTMDPDAYHVRTTVGEPVRGGDLLRFNVATIAAAEGWTVELTVQEQ